MKIAYLGPEGTYCNEAARAFAQKMSAPDAELVPCTSFHDVFDSVEHGRCDYGVVALENSLEGAVTATYDDFASESSIEILGTTVIDVEHCLVARSGVQLQDVRTIVSHPQALGQCRRFLARELSQARRISSASTAESVKSALSDPTCAAIANRSAAESYGASVLCEGIADSQQNQTSFALIGPAGTPSPLPGECCKTSVALFIHQNRAGVLNMILSEFAYAGVNITMIQSRPTKEALGDYMFFLDLEGSIDDPSLQTALECLRLKLRAVKVLGSYPVG